MKQAVIYARYSSDKQTEDSIEAQVRACRSSYGSQLTIASPLDIEGRTRYTETVVQGYNPLDVAFYAFWRYGA